jgi:hypothetical protein
MRAVICAHDSELRGVVPSATTQPEAAMLCGY